MKTGKDGTYRVEVTKGSWHVTATISRDYNGHKYRIDLHPKAAEDFGGADGGVRDFVWALTGDRPDGLGGYGEKVVAYAPLGDFTFEPRDVELTLTPAGPLVNGSKGRALTGKLVHTPDGDAVKDVPLGRYTITARLAPAGKAAEPMRVRMRNKGEFAESVTADFDTPFGPDSRLHRLELEVKRP